MVACAFLGASSAHAQAIICLDFDGAAIPRWKTRSGVLKDIRIPAYNHPGSDPRTLDGAERTAINFIRLVVEEDFSPFDVVVITETSETEEGDERVICPVDPPAAGMSRIVIGGHASDFKEGFDRNGIAPMRGFTSTDPDVSDMGLAFALDARSRTLLAATDIGDTVSHELGHTFGLQHQVLFLPDGTVVESPGAGGILPIMGGNAVNPSRTLWQIGPAPPLLDEDGTSLIPGGGPAFIQDDMRIIASRYASDLPDLYNCQGPYVPSNCEVMTPNGFGYKRDDHGNYAGAATPLQLTNGSSLAGSGIIERVDDVDYFSFVVPQGGTLMPTVRAQVKVNPTQPNLDAQVAIVDSSGQRVFAEAEVDGVRLLDAVVSEPLAPGAYRLAVRGHGDPGDTGQYTVSVTVNSRIRITRAIPFSDRLRVTFNAEVLDSTFTTSDALIEDGRGHRETALAIRRVSNLARTFDIFIREFATMDGARITVGPHIMSLTRQRMDQDPNSTSRADDDFEFEDFDPPGVARVEVLPNAIRVDFDEPIDPDSFTLAGVDLEDRNGLAVPGVGEPVDVSDTRFEIPIAAYPIGGFRLVVGDGVRDWFGNLITTPHVFERFDDSGPSVASYFLAENSGPIPIAGNALIVSFDEAIDLASLEHQGAPTIRVLHHPPSTGSFVAQRSRGVPVVVTSVTSFEGPSIHGASDQPNRHWIVEFIDQGFGDYTVIATTRIRDLFGNEMNQDGDARNGEIFADYFEGSFELKPRASRDPIDPHHAHGFEDRAFFDEAYYGLSLDFDDGRGDPELFGSGFGQAEPSALFEREALASDRLVDPVDPKAGIGEEVFMPEKW